VANAARGTWRGCLSRGEGQGATQSPCASHVVATDLDVRALGKNHDTKTRAGLRGARDGALERGAGATSPFSTGLTRLTDPNSKNVNTTPITLDTKVVDETLAFNFCKGP
jgi:hypothetical protein